MVNALPALYDQINIYNSQMNPSTIHASNTALSGFFARYLMLRVLSRYEFNLPEDWDPDYFRYCLFTLGFVGVMNTDRFGVICQHGTVSGYNVYYRPTRLMVTNPALRKTYDLVINEDCSIIKLSPDWRGCWDVVQLYADQMAICMEAFGVNTINSKFAFVFAAENKTMAETMKKTFDQIAGGQPAAFVDDKQLFDDDGNPRWELFTNNLKQNYVGNELLQSLTTIENKFNTFIGFNNTSYEKKERLVTDEVNANNDEVKSLCTLWLETMNKDMQKANELFGLNLSVKLRDFREGGSNDDAVSDGTVSL